MSFRSNFLKERHLKDEERGLALAENGSDAHSENSDDAHLYVDLGLEPFPENIYGFCMASLIRDVADAKLHGPMKLMRLCSALVLLIFMFTLQVYLLLMTEQLVSPSYIHDTREAYAQFETVMYTDSSGVAHTEILGTGFPRGIDGYFDASNFEKLSNDDKETICSIPLSQPLFLWCLLSIWALTVFAHVRQSVNVALRYLFLPSALPDLEDDEDHTSGIVLAQKEESVVVECLPLWVKGALLGAVQIPRVCVCLLLLWIGSRWLLATIDLGEVFLNALALEMLLNFSELLYVTMVPYHNKIMVQRTLLPHLGRAEPENCRSMFGMLLLGAAAFAFAGVYMYRLQAVLPDYKFDVRQVCNPFLENQLKVK